MLSVLWPSLFVALSGSLSVGSILIVLLLLSSQRGAWVASSYVFGYCAGYLSLGGVLWLASQRTAALSVSKTVSSSVLIGLGGLLLFFAFRSWKKEASEEKPSFFSFFDAISPQKSAFFGFLVALLNVKNLALFLSSLSFLLASHLAINEGLVVLFSIVLVFCFGVYLPLFVYLLFPKRSAAFLAWMRWWLEAKKRALSIGVLLFFGVIFSGRGLLFFLRG
ncbi:GAP family protein [Myxococcota bacterium]|nr:GAP family protein [Myxococcota bacterium]